GHLFPRYPKLIVSAFSTLDSFNSRRSFARCHFKDASVYSENRFPLETLTSLIRDCNIVSNIEWLSAYFNTTALMLPMAFTSLMNSLCNLRSTGIFLNAFLYKIQLRTLRTYIGLCVMYSSYLAKVLNLRTCSLAQYHPQKYIQIP